jgi:hypothetical protein
VTAVTRVAEQLVDAIRRANISWVTRVFRCLLAGVGVTAAAVLFGGPAFAAPSQVTFEPAKVPVVFSATGTAGGPISVQADVLESTLLLGETPPYLPAPPEGESYLEIEFQMAEGQVPSVPLALPLSAATLVTAEGTVSPTGVDLPPWSSTTDWYFPVADSTTKATLEIGPATVTADGNNGTSQSYTIAPTTIRFVTAPAVVVPGPTVSGPGRRTPATPGSVSPAQALGIGVGALVVVGAATPGLVLWRRRRAFYRADRQGRVILVGPPLLATELAGARLPDEGSVPPQPPRPRHSIVVKLLGWLDIAGVEPPVMAGPLREIVVFLVLNPGRSFTSVQLRESVWGLGRQPITPATFRKYMVHLRKAIGPGVVVTARYRYEMTDAVTSDWAMFLLLRDENASQALELVRGPVLNGCFDGKKNSPFAWAVAMANAIEDQITTVAHDLADSYLDDLDDPVRATTTLSHGLRCAQANLALRLLDLRTGAALGGVRELSRRLEAGRAAMATFPMDVEQLEEQARHLGWEAALPG